MAKRFIEVKKKDGNKLILLKRINPIEYEIHFNEINQTKNLILTTFDFKLAERIVEGFNKNHEK